jgi:hypothetical protein
MRRREFIALLGSSAGGIERLIGIDVRRPAINGWGRNYRHKRFANHEHEGTGWFGPMLSTCHIPADI